jgi:hypothetical protein
MYEKRINVWVVGAGLTPAERAKIFQEAIKQNQSLIDRINWDFLKKGSAEELQGRRDNFLNRGNQ